MVNGSIFYSPLWYNGGLAFVRIIVGLLLAYHGWEVFQNEKMDVYLEWESFKDYSSPKFMVYLGKASELVAGILLALGLLTRLATVVAMFTMSYITFFVGSGKIWYEDQHPFMFVLLALLFFFTGPGKWSIDHSLFNRTRQQNSSLNALTKVQVSPDTSGTMLNMGLQMAKKVSCELSIVSGEWSG